MSRHTIIRARRQDRASLYTEITDKIIAELEAGRIPWVQPWGTAAIKAPLAMPRNASTQRGYSGINVLILWGAVIEHGFSGQSWLTFRQALGLGGHVRKGERGTTVVYADRFVPRGERQHAAETGEEPGTIPFLKRFTVFFCVAATKVRNWPTLFQAHDVHTVPLLIVSPARMETRRPQGSSCRMQEAHRVAMGFPYAILSRYIFRVGTAIDER